MFNFFLLKNINNTQKLFAHNKKVVYKLVIIVYWFIASKAKVFDKAYIKYREVVSLSGSL